VNVGFNVVGAKAVEAAFRGAGATIQPRLVRRVNYWGNVMVTQIRGNASGRPGPNAPTGDYRRSWTVETGMVGGDASAMIGTNKPQGRRLELGFVGADSLGRVYNQGPLPHVRPAVDMLTPRIQADLGKEATRGL
jgi:hypothetical protein